MEKMNDKATFHSSTLELELGIYKVTIESSLEPVTDNATYAVMKVLDDMNGAPLIAVNSAMRDRLDKSLRVKLTVNRFQV